MFDDIRKLGNEEELSRNDKQGILQSACVSEITLKALRHLSNKFIVDSS